MTIYQRMSSLTIEQTKLAVERRRESALQLQKERQDRRASVKASLAKSLEILSSHHSRSDLDKDPLHLSLSSHSTHSISSGENSLGRSFNSVDVDDDDWFNASFSDSLSKIPNESLPATTPATEVTSKTTTATERRKSGSSRRSSRSLMEEIVPSPEHKATINQPRRGVSISPRKKKKTLSMRKMFSMSPGKAKKNNKSLSETWHGSGSLALDLPLTETKQTQEPREESSLPPSPRKARRSSRASPKKKKKSLTMKNMFTTSPGKAKKSKSLSETWHGARSVPLDLPLTESEQAQQSQKDSDPVPASPRKSRRASRSSPKKKKKSLNMKNMFSMSPSKTKKTKSLSNTWHGPRSVALELPLVSESECSQTERSQRTVKSSRPKGNVSFQNITIYEHALILGDHPGVSEGVPTTIAWKSQRSTEMGIEDYDTQVIQPRMLKRKEAMPEIQRSPSKGKSRKSRNLARRAARRQFVIPGPERVRILLEAGFTTEAIVEASLEVNAIQEERMESLRNFQSRPMQQLFDAPFAMVMVGLRKLKQPFTAVN